jgi:hypothetical protein
MARVRCSPNEIDQNFQIESAIADLLLRGETAEIALSSLEKCYSMLEHVDHGEEMTPFHRLSRHDQIVSVLQGQYDIDDVDYEFADDDVKFRRRL